MATFDLHKLVAQIDDHAETALIPPNEGLQHALTNTRAKGLPPIQVASLQGQFLAIQAQLIGAKSVLEIGALGGYSTIWLASSGAHVTSIEINPKHRDVALENVKAAGYGDQVDVVLGAALDILPKLKEQGKIFDLVFIDADWGEQFEYFQWAVELTHTNSAIYIDNVVRTILEGDGRSVVGDVKEENLITKIGREQKVQATLVTDISGHKRNKNEIYDGFIFARRV